MLLAGQFLTLALKTLILSIFYISLDCLQFILLFLVGVELPLCVIVTQCCVMFSGVKLNIRSFNLFVPTLHDTRGTFTSKPRPSVCSHELGAVNYPRVMIAPGQGFFFVHIIILCPGASSLSSDYHQLL